MIKNGIIETKNLQCLKKMIQILRTLLNVGFVIMFIISDAHMYLLFEKGMRMWVLRNIIKPTTII